MPPAPTHTPVTGRGSTGRRRRPLLQSLAAGLVALVLGYAFLRLGSGAAEVETRAFDTRLLLAAASLRAAHPGLAQVMRELSVLGSATVLTLIALLAAGYLVVVSAWTSAVFLSASVITGSVLVALFKSAFGRLRPDPAYADSVVAGLSYPSGHASASAIVFLTLGALVAARRDSRAERSFILASAALLTMLVGLSRIGLGLHWATDVLGGWAFGACWALAWLLLDRSLLRR